MSNDIYKKSLDYHSSAPCGKLAVVATKPLDGREHLMMAYSPGVAEPCRRIAKDPSEAFSLTSRSNLIAVITNGTAVLGLGDIGPLAAKPVMEGKSVLFKKFANVNAFDIEINEKDPDKLIEIIASLEPTFGGINLEDIKSPECFYIEQKLKEKLNIPVFHDDQHGTAIIVGAAILNALELVNKDIANVKLVCSGAGAAAIACLELLMQLGMKRENITIFDRKGIVHKERDDLDKSKAQFAQNTGIRTLADALKNADILLGLSVGGIISADMVKDMSLNPIILALSNPEPEIMPDVVQSVRGDAIIATGRSDFPNQVNNVLCFPYIFRGALDVGATSINNEMKIACVRAIARIARAENSDLVSSAYGGEVHNFGPKYIIPKPFDPRLFVELAYDVAKAAVDSGVATRPIKDWQTYRDKLVDFIYESNAVMRTIFKSAKCQQKPVRLVFSDGENQKVLQAAQMLSDEKMAYPILIGRPDVITRNIAHLGLRLARNQDYEIVDPNENSDFSTYWQQYHLLLERSGVTPDLAQSTVLTNPTVIGALMLYLKHADALICGIVDQYMKHFDYVSKILGCGAKDSSVYATMMALVVRGEPVFITDPYLNENPTAEELANIAVIAASQVKRFGIEPKIALVSHSNFGSRNYLSAKKMKDAVSIIKKLDSSLQVEGEMNADIALNFEARGHVFPHSTFEGSANLLVMPNIESANIAINLCKGLEKYRSIGPMLLGLDYPVHIVTPSITTRGIFNLSSLAVVDALNKKS